MENVNEVAPELTERALPPLSVSTRPLCESPLIAAADAVGVGGAADRHAGHGGGDRARAVGDLQVCPVGCVLTATA